MLTFPKLPNGFDLRYNGDTTHTLTFNGRPLPLEWVRGLNARVLVDGISEPRRRFTPIGRVVTGRQYTWQHLAEYEFLSDADKAEVTRFPGVEFLAVIGERIDLLAFIDPRAVVYPLPIDDDDPMYFVTTSPVLYQPSESTIALSNLNR